MRRDEGEMIEQGGLAYFHWKGDGCTWEAVILVGFQTSRTSSPQKTLAANWKKILAEEQFMETLMNCSFSTR
jgi:hypothetical protein